MTFLSPNLQKGAYFLRQVYEVSAFVKLFRFAYDLVVTWLRCSYVTVCSGLPSRLCKIGGTFMTMPSKGHSDALHDSKECLVRQ